MKIIEKSLILSLLLIFGTARSEDLANGIVIYKTNPSSSDEFAITIEFSKIEVHPRALKGVKADDSPINLPSTNVVAYFNYPDLKSGTISSTTQIAEFMELGKRMVDAAGKYPTAAKAMGARLEEMKTAAVKFNQGWFLAGGEWKQSMSQKTGKASQTTTGDLKILNTKTGQSYSFRTVKQYSSNQVTIEHTGGITKVDLGNLTEESLALLNQDADFKRLKKVDEDSASAITGQRAVTSPSSVPPADAVVFDAPFGFENAPRPPGKGDAKSQEEALSLARTEILKKKEAWEKSVAKGDPSGNLKKLAELVKSNQATLKDWKRALGVYDQQAASFSALLDIVQKPDASAKTKFGSQAWQTDEAVSIGYANACLNEITGKPETIYVIAIPAIDSVVAMIVESDRKNMDTTRNGYDPYQEYFLSLVKFSRLDTETLESWGVEIPLLLKYKAQSPVGVELIDQRNLAAQLEASSATLRLINIQAALGIQKATDQFLKNIGPLLK
jgi:hypothetical protein